MTNRKYNLKPSSKDDRDFKFSAPHLAKVKLPKQSSLSSLDNLIPIFDQLALGSCTGNGWARMRMLLELIYKQKSTTPDMLSRLYIYVRERILENTINEDSGASPRDGAKSLLNYGVCKEILYPYDITKFTNLPTPQEDQDAINYKINSYSRINNLAELKQCIVSGFPVGIGFTVYSEFENIGSNGILKMPKKNSQILGGHWVMCRGYKDGANSSTGYLEIVNSWSDQWANKGVFYMPYKYITFDQNFEMWTIR